MILWVLAGKRQGNGYGFPFDLPLADFHQRLGILYEALTLWKDSSHAAHHEKDSLVDKLLKDLTPVMEDQELRAAFTDIREKKQVFDQLRDAMRIAQPDGKGGLNDDGEDLDLGTIEEDVTAFHEALRQRPDFTKHGSYGKMAEQIEKYWDKLFADPIQVETPSGTTTIYPQRTNNILERFFRRLNRDHRRRTGENAMNGALQAMLADTPLVKNLEKPTYMEILLDGSPSLEERFARIDAKRIRLERRKARRETARLLPGLKKVLSLPKWPLDVAKQWIQCKAA